MALRQSGIAALRLLTQQQAGSTGSKALSSAFISAARVAGADAIEAQAVTGAVQVSAGQYSFEAASALAAKKAHLTGAAGLGAFAAKGQTSKAFSTFAASRVTPAAAAPAAAAAAEEKPSMLRRMARAAAVIMGAVALATGTASADAPEPWQFLFQDTATSTGQAMVDLHHDINFFVATIAVFVIYMLFQIATKFHYTRQLKPEKLTHHTTLEVIWTIIPTIIVLSIAVPSLTLIYSLDQHTDRPGLTVKVIGRQWYWSYEMHDHLQQKLLDPDRLVAIAEKSIVKA